MANLAISDLLNYKANRIDAMPNEHVTSEWHRTDVGATLSRRIDVSSTSFRRHVPAGCYSEVVCSLSTILVFIITEKKIT